MEQGRIFNLIGLILIILYPLLFINFIYSHSYITTALIVLFVFPIIVVILAYLGCKKGDRKIGEILYVVTLLIFFTFFGSVWIFGILLFSPIFFFVYRKINKKIGNMMIMIFIIISFFLMGASYRPPSPPMGNDDENYNTQSTGRLSQAILIEEPKSGAIAIRNIGARNISVTDLSVYINGTLRTCNWSLSVYINGTLHHCNTNIEKCSSVVLPGATITADCTCTEGQTIKVSGPANSDKENCVI